jgi:uncharacterized delta-60 repeat protein
MASAIIALFNAALPAPAAEVAQEAWVKRFSNIVSNAEDQAFKLVRDAQGNIIVAGSTGRDMLTLKHSGADGSLLWLRRYNGPANGTDIVRDVAVDAAGNVVVTGSSDGAIYPDFYTAKYAADDGALLWEHRYNGPNGGPDTARSVVVDASGNVVVTGDSSGTNVYSEYYTAKYAGVDGALLWERRYNSSGWSIAQAVAVDASGNVVVTGQSLGTNSLPDYYTAKYATADGALLWERRYNGPANWVDSAFALALDGAGNVVVTGYSNNGSNDDSYTAKYAAADGALLWERRYNGPFSRNDRTYLVAVDSSGNALVAGCSDSTNRFNPNPDVFTAKYAAADGALLWEKRYNGPGNRDDFALGLAMDSDGNVAVTGFVVSTNFNNDYYTAKYAGADGALLWERHYNGPANFQDEAQAVMMDDVGNVVVTGYSHNTDFNADCYTAKYAAADGTLLWDHRYNGPANSSAQVQAVAVDPGGNVVVTGFAANDRNYADYYTAKYAAADGALLWEQRYNGPTDLNDVARAVAVDASGNVVVTGLSERSYYTAKYAAADGTLLWEQRAPRSTVSEEEGPAMALDASGNVVVAGSASDNFNPDSSDYCTVKYAAADGAVLWEQDYNGPGNQGDYAQAVAVDANGDVLVTGSSVNTNANADYHTNKYAAADGALLWERRYDGPSNGYDEARAVAVDRNGNVVVTGRSLTRGGFTPHSDYHTVKYAAANGALLWEKRYDGPDSVDDYVQAVAVDASDNVVVAGNSGSSGFLSSYIAKYAAADGSLLWENRYDPEPSGFTSFNTANAVVVDASGNVFVTGISYSNLTFNTTDYYTVKYAADGSLLWETRYNGPADGNDSIPGSRALALGPNGSIVITGVSDSVSPFGTTSDYATVKYVTITYPTPIVLSLAVTTEGAQLRFIGDTGRTYRIQRASDPAGPWATLATVTAPPGGVLEYLDPPSHFTAGFYRIAAP